MYMLLRAACVWEMTTKLGLGKRLIIILQQYTTAENDKCGSSNLLATIGPQLKENETRAHIRPQHGHTAAAAHTTAAAEQTAGSDSGGRRHGLSSMRPCIVPGDGFTSATTTTWHGWRRPVRPRVVHGGGTPLLTTAS